MTARLLTLALLGGLVPAVSAAAADDLDRFAREMAERHGMDSRQVRSLLAASERRDDILERISSPAEALPWHRYRPIFLREDRILQGREFWDAHAALLEAVGDRFGVAPEILVAIVGVETRYGAHAGSFRVIDALRTLAFDYPPRAAFFRSELEHFLLLTREERIDPLEAMGSYAGAMGVPQFISSSYRSYAVDYDGNGRRNLWDEPGDVLGSVANYLARHRWRDGEPVAVPAEVSGSAWRGAVDDPLKPQRTAGALRALGVRFESELPDDAPARLLELEVAPGESGYWVTFHNFYVITRYNRSPLYAMAVLQLAEAIRTGREGA